MVRGTDQLSDWAEVRTASGELYLQLRCTNDVASQVESRLGSKLGSRLQLRQQDRGEWTHRYPLAEALDDSERAFLELLTSAVTLRLKPEVDIALSIDFYKDPKSDLDPMKWDNTPIGELVHGGKYGESDDAGKELADRLTAFIDLHPELRSSEVIVAVPSHSARKFSERLAGAVARRRNLPFIILADDVTTPIKDMEIDARPLPTYGLADPDAVRGKDVLLIDDVVRTGETLRAAAGFLRSQGARSLRVVAAVKTMRN